MRVAFVAVRQMYAWWRIVVPDFPGFGDLAALRVCHDFPRNVEAVGVAERITTPVLMECDVVLRGSGMSVEDLNERAAAHLLDRKDDLVDVVRCTDAEMHVSVLQTTRSEVDVQLPWLRRAHWDVMRWRYAAEAELRPVISLLARNRRLVTVGWCSLVAGLALRR
jgi:hypothetical protein